MQNTTQKTKDRATRTSQKPVRYLAPLLQQPLLFFEIYMLPNMDTGQAIRIVTRWPLVERAPLFTTPGRVVGWAMAIVTNI
jgi:hypothetical protein